MQLAQKGAAAQQFPSRLFRSVDGRTRSDFGDTSVITDPNTGKAILLDHLKKEARLIPQPPPMPQMPMTPRMPSLPGAPAAMPPVDIKDLGKSMIDGHEVEGKLYTIPMPNIPAPPSPPGMPTPPSTPQMPLTTEVWTSTTLLMPVLTKTMGSFGQQICQCRLVPTEPPATAFQIPPDYKQISQLTPPTPPAYTRPAAPSITVPTAPAITPPKFPR